MPKKVRNQKKLKPSQKVYITLSEHEKKIAKVCKGFVQEHKSSKVKNLFSRLDELKFDIPTLDNLTRWDLNKELNDIKRHEKITDMEMSLLFLRCETHILLLSKTDFSERVKYLKDMKEWENTLVYDLVNKWLELTNNYITKELQVDLPIIIVNLFDNQLSEDYNKEVDIILQKMVQSYSRSLADGLNQLLNRTSIKDLTRIREYLDLYIVETINMGSIIDTLNELIIEKYTKMIEFIGDDLYDLLLEISEKIASDFIIDIVSIKNEAQPFASMSWRELEKLAIDKGYEYIRSNGDHGIYKNSSNNMVIIPRGRAIGKGLQMTILKQIKS